MAEIPLTPKERQALKAQAHALKPVVLLGSAGLTPAVIKEIDRALTAHQLIKIRVPGDDRAQREATWAALADTLSAGRVQAIGKLLVLYRPAPDDEGDSRQTPARARGDEQTRRGKSSRADASGNKRQRAEVQQVRRTPAARRDPGRAHRAAGRRNAPKRSRG